MALVIEPVLLPQTACVVFPNSEMLAIAVAIISAIITAYSTAVGPDSSCINRMILFLNSVMVLMGCEGQGEQRFLPQKQFRPVASY